jgi:hypothetical protein
VSGDGKLFTDCAVVLLTENVRNSTRDSVVLEYTRWILYQFDAIECVVPE